MHWGYKIIGAYIMFIMVLGIMAYKSFQTKVDLVADDYYQQELRYQQRIDMENNEKALAESVSVRLIPSQQQLVLRFPQNTGVIKGRVTLYRPSDADQDRSWELKTLDDNIQVLPMEDLAPGLWKLQIQWEANGLSYYKQENVFLP